MLEWKDVIGFDPLEHFSRASFKDANHLKKWARTGDPFPMIPLPRDPNDNTRSIPHGAHVEFDKIPVAAIPPSVLRQWLFYRGVPHPKGTLRKDLIEQVQLARSLVQPLDEEVIASANKASAKSYVPADNITVLTEVVWTTNKYEVLAALRNDDTPKSGKDRGFALRADISTSIPCEWQQHGCETRDRMRRRIYSK